LVEEGKWFKCFYESPLVINALGSKQAQKSK
jgi:hypothetical protein